MEYFPRPTPCPTLPDKRLAAHWMLTFERLQPLKIMVLARTVGESSVGHELDDKNKQLQFDAPVDGAEAVSTLPLIGVGASAGGLEALETFFAACPTDSGAAFVVVQHLMSDHKSMMASLLARHTAMPVELATQDAPLLADHVYLIPPGMLMRIEGNHFVLWPKGSGVFSLPIDIFLTSMAASHGARTVAIILSGTGSDGTRGAAEVNAAGGLVLAQQPDTAKFDGMPRSVISAGTVDAILPPEQLALSAISFLQNRKNRSEIAIEMRESQRAGGSQQDRFAAILETLLDIGEIDFKEYKEATVLRRVERRMQMCRSEDMGDYLDRLNSDRAEAGTLRREILIGVTSFFRDSEAYLSLASNVIAPIVREKKRGEVIRVWCAGISSGEEAYSIAMLFLEEFERQQRWCQLKLFGTDVDAVKIEHASQGIYPESAAAELTHERLQRYFTRDNAQIAVKIDLRQYIVFARHNLLTDPPFTKMDLVTCRNTLIYFKPPAQERALARLQYGLLPGGFLFLGSSESLGPQVDTVLTVDSKHKIYRRTAGENIAVMTPTAFGMDRPFVGRVRGAKISEVVDREVRATDTATAMLLEAHAPPSLLVHRTGEVVHLFGDLQSFVTVQAGAASLQLERLLPKVLASTCFALVSRVLREAVPVTVTVMLPQEGEHAARSVSVLCRPLPGGTSAQHALISLHAESLPRLPDTGREGPPAAPLPGVSGLPTLEAMDHVNVLERELQATRESLQATIEELETSNEELQATNEEMVSSNEELQSSNEELQSLNEELHTVNSEFQEKLELLHRAHADLESMARAAGVATLFVDDRLRLTRFSPDATPLFKLQPSDVGRRLDDFANLLDYPDLISDLEQTLDTHLPVEKEITGLDGSETFLARILPYAVPSTQVRGVVATFINITAYHDAQRLQTILDALPEHISVLAPDGTITVVNQAWRTFARNNGDPEMLRSGPGTNYLEVCRLGGEGADAATRASVEHTLAGIRGVLDGSLPSFSSQYPCHSPDERRWFVMHVTPVHIQGFGAVISHFDISAWLRQSGQAAGVEEFIRG